MPVCCPVCEKEVFYDSAVIAGGGGAYQTPTCPNCRLRFAWPMEHPGREWYERSWLYEHRTDPLSPTPSVGEWRYRSALARLGRENGCLFDAGCGDGAFLEMARNAGWDPWGCDLDARSVDTAHNKRGLKNVRRTLVEDLVGQNGYCDFSAITAFELVEHVADPLSFLKTLRGALRPGGRIVITVPNLDRVPAVFDPDVDFPPHHLTLWTARALRTLFERAGFCKTDIIEKPLTTGDYFGHVILAAKRRLRAGRRDFFSRALADSNKTLGAKRLLRAVALIATAFVVVSLRAMRLGRGHTLLCVAENPA